jgi:hypothetical protein
MPDLAAELRHAIETAMRQMLDGQAVQRGWDDAAAHTMAIESPTGGSSETTTAVVFATGYDGSLTVTPFTFDMSAFNGPDTLV